MVTKADIERLRNWSIAAVNKGPCGLANKMACGIFGGHYISAMKLEIDLTDRASLLKTQAELNRMLNIVKFALEQIPNHRPNGQMERSNLVFLEPEQHRLLDSNRSNIDQEVLHIIYKLPGKRFTTSDVMVEMGTKAKEKRGAIKMALKRAVDADFIRILEPGKGRKPSTYERVLEGLAK